MNPLEAQSDVTLPRLRLGALVTVSLIAHLAVVYALQPRTPEFNLSVNNQVVQVTLSNPSNIQNTDLKPIQKQTTPTQAVKQPTQPPQSENKTKQSEAIARESNITPVAEPIQPQSTPAPNVIHQPEQTDVNQDVITQLTQTITARDPQTDLMSMEEVNARVISKLDHDIRQHFTYPLMARKRGWEGVVKLDIEVDSQGKIASIVMSQSSGYKLLDKAAQEALMRIGHIGDAAGWLRGRRLNTTVPVIYKLKNG